MKWPGIISWLFLSAAVVAQTASSQPAACVRCHAQAKSQPGTSMANALETVEQCKTLIEHPLLTVTLWGYSYRIERNGNQSSFSVTDGVRTLTLPIRWAMGASSAIGQTYVLEKDGELYESRVSYFRELNRLGPTLGSADSVPADLKEAAGRLMSHDDKLKCFGCHSTHATMNRQVTLDKMVPGVRCERCHERTEEHLAAILVSGFDPDTPRKFSKFGGMTAEQAANFCGQCHRTWAEIAVQPNPSIANIRFQPYRLTGSKCYDPDDARISCLACHDPHQEVNRQIADYDSRCQACHGGGKPGAKACPVAKKECTSCHMPKLELPGGHHKFSDHRIRVVKPNETYPG